MEMPLHEKASYAFYTYVFNDYDNFIKPLQKHIRNSYIDDKSHEIMIQNAICKLLSEKIREHIPTIPEIKTNFRKSVKLLSQQDLDLIEFNEKFKNREDKLKTYIKLHYLLDDIDDGNFELDHASLLMAIYSKIISLELQPNGKREHFNKIIKIPQLKNSPIYQYLDSARKEAKYHTTLNQLSNLTMTELANWLYTSIAVFDYNNDNTVIDQYIGTYDEGDYFTTIFNEVAVINLDDDPVSYEEFLELIEKDFNEKLIQEMHTLENGQIF